MDAGSPEDFIRHPVSYPGESILIEEEALEAFAGMVPDDCLKAGAVKGRFMGLWRQVGPPVGWGRTLMETDPAELSVIGKDEGGMGHDEHEVIMPCGDHLGLGGCELPGHPEVETKPQIFREPETELLAVGFGLEKPATLKGGSETGGIGFAEDTGPGMEMDLPDPLSDGGKPLLAVKLDFGKFGHVG